MALHEAYPTLPTRALEREPDSIADPRPGLTDVEWRQWLHLRQALATGTGIRRNPLRLRDASPGSFDAHRHIDAPRILLTVHERETVRGDARVSLLMAGGSYYRTIDIPGPTVDEYGDPVPAHPGEIDIAHYRRTQQQRQALDHKSRYFAGWRAPDKHRPLFGEDRFRTFTQEPYFPDRVGFILYTNATATRWNDYRLA